MLPTPDIADQYPDRVVALELQFVNAGGIEAFKGEAVTVKCFEDNSVVKELVSQPGEGRVIVVDGGASLRRALLGDMLAAKAREHGWSGLVINGAVRDVDQLRAENLGVKCLGVIPLKTDKLGVGQQGIALHFGGARIEPGNWIYADNNGVLVADGELEL